MPTNGHNKDLDPPESHPLQEAADTKNQPMLSN